MDFTDYSQTYISKQVSINITFVYVWETNISHKEADRIILRSKMTNAYSNMNFKKAESVTHLREGKDAC